MAFSREFLNGLGIEGLTKEKIDAIMNEQGATAAAVKKAADEALNAVKSQRDARPDISADDLTKLRDDLASAQASLKSFEGVDVATIENDLAAAQQAKSELEAKQAEQLGAIATDLLLRERLATETFSSDYAKSGVFADVKGKVTYEPGENGAIGTIAGYDEAIAEIRESKPAAFAAVGAPPPKKDEAKQHKSGGGQPSEPASLKDALTQKYSK